MTRTTTRELTSSADRIRIVAGGTLRGVDEQPAADLPEPIERRHP